MQHPPCPRPECRSTLTKPIQGGYLCLKCDTGFRPDRPAQTTPPPTAVARAATEIAQKLTAEPLTVDQLTDLTASLEQDTTETALWLLFAQGKTAIVVRGPYTGWAKP